MKNEVHHQLTVSNNRKKAQQSLISFAELSLAWLVVFVLIRIAEVLLNGFAHQFPDNTGWFLLKTLWSDLSFFCRLNLPALVLFIPLFLLSPRSARIIYILFAILSTLGYLALVQYFKATIVPLGADLYSYSWQEIQQTVGASGQLNALTIILMIGVVVLIIAAIIWLSRIIKPGLRFTFGWVALILVAGILSATAILPPASFSKEYDNNLGLNKLNFFLTASASHFFPEPAEVDIYSDAYIGDFGEATGTTPIAAFSYPDETNYPFLHTDSTPDVLSPFFKRSDAAPNIVIILVEGLGRAFTNEGAYLGNFTPFLDSLSQHSLYWENFLSGGGRTFAVLPSVLGSLPFGKNGFNELGNQMPAHHSLVSLLKKNNYFTSFYYCGDASFDNMNIFLQKQSIDRISDKKTFPAGYVSLPENNGFSWGYGDKELFRYFIAEQKKRTTTQPALQVLLTVATHSPFLVNDQDHYNEAFEKRMTVLNFTDQQKQEHRQYKLQFASVLYADDALQYFFEQYKQLPDYSNTVFLITGDHRMPEIPMISKIDRYHVPLVVYSPMLERTARFQSVSTHFDMAPSLLSWLGNNYGIKKPSLVTWMGSGLDTTHAFRNIHANPFMQTKTDLLDFVMGNLHLNSEEVFRINNTLNEEKLNDNIFKESMQGAFSKFQQKNAQFISGAKLIPDSLYRNWHP